MLWPGTYHACWRPLQRDSAAPLPSRSSHCIPALPDMSFLCVQGQAFPPIPQVSGTAHHWVFMLGEWAPCPASSLPFCRVHPQRVHACVLRCTSPEPRPRPPCHSLWAQTPPLSSLCSLGRSLALLRLRPRAGLKLRVVQGVLCGLHPCLCIVLHLNLGNSLNIYLEIHLKITIIILM